MCRIFAGQGPETYSYQTRSVRLGGHSTSIRLEAAFWRILDEIAAAENVSLGKFLTTLHDEVLAFRGETNNFTSLLRCACLAHVAQVRAGGRSAPATATEAASLRPESTARPRKNTDVVGPYYLR